MKAHVRLFGLAYSLAVAPAAMVPPGLPSLVKDDVERRAIDLAEAGQRLYLQDKPARRSRCWRLDQLGNRHPLEGFDELRRRTDKGLRAAAQIAAFWRREQGRPGHQLDAAEFFDHFADTTSYSRPFVARDGDPQGDPAWPRLEIVDTIGILGGVAEDEANADRSLPWGEVYAVRRERRRRRGAGALRGRRPGRADQDLQLRLANGGDAAAYSRLLLMVPGRRHPASSAGSISATWRCRPAAALELDFGPGTADGAFQLQRPALAQPVGGAAQVRDLVLPPFRIVGSHQETRLDEQGPDDFGNWYRPNRHGNGMTYLFNRPPLAEEAGSAAVWKIVSRLQRASPTSGGRLRAPPSRPASPPGCSPTASGWSTCATSGLVGAQIDASTQATLLHAPAPGSRRHLSTTSSAIRLLGGGAAAGGRDRAAAHRRPGRRPGGAGHRRRGGRRQG